MPFEKTDEWRDKPCGCRAQKSIFTSTIKIEHDMWIVREQCQDHKAENDAFMRWLSEGGHESSEEADE